MVAGGRDQQVRDPVGKYLEGGGDQGAGQANPSNQPRAASPSRTIFSQGWLPLQGGAWGTPRPATCTNPSACRPAGATRLSGDVLGHHDSWGRATGILADISSSPLPGPCHPSD